MGAQSFVVLAHGETAAEAFEAAVEEAQYEHGHGGYTGTIAEKDEFRMVEFPKILDRAKAEKYADYLLDEGNEDFYHDKWGDAGCFDLGNGEYMFFGRSPC